MPEVKGVLILGRLEILKDRYGEQAVEAAIPKLNPDDRSVLSAKFLPSSWYPYEVLRVIDRLTRHIPPEKGRLGSLEVGQAMAQYVCSGVYKSMVVHDPLKQVGRICWVGDMLYRNYRRCETAMTGDGSCVVTYAYEEGAVPTPGMCKSTTGFLMRLMELAGAKAVSGVHERCVNKGAKVCEFRLRWS